MSQTILSKFRLLTYGCAGCATLYEVFQPQTVPPIPPPQLDACGKCAGISFNLLADENISTVKTVDKNAIGA